MSIQKSMQKTGLIVGKFYPLHQGHINMILSAKLAVDQLHVFVCSETERDYQLYLESAFTKRPTSDDRINWAKKLLQGIEGITIHGFNEDGIPAYPNGWQAWSDRLKASLKSKDIHPNIIFSSELQDKDFYEKYFQTAVILVDPPRDKFPVSATKIRNSPFQYWTFIPTIIRPFFTRTIIIEQDCSDNRSLLPATLQLFNGVEVIGYEKIIFLTIMEKEISATLLKLQQEKRKVSAIIGSARFIQSFQNQLSSSGTSLSKPETLLVPKQRDNPAKMTKIEQDQALFNEISSFINRLMLSNSTFP